MSAKRSDARIVRAQLSELQRHVISLYALLVANACALAATHYPMAPGWLTVAVPAALALLCFARAVRWLRMRPGTATAEQCVRQLQMTSVLTALLATCFIAWALALDAYGGPYERGHLAIFVAITVVGCIFCLTHLPVAAFMVTGIVMVPFLIHCLMSGNAVFAAIAINIVFVTVVMVRVLATNFVAFLQLVESQAEAQRLVDENARLAHTDSLTGLPNRRFFFQALERLIEGAAGDGEPFGLAIFDLDRFKPINDTFGHTAGDRVLAVTGQRLEAFAGPAVTVARLGGDEFGVLIRAPGSTPEAIALCNQICEALRAPIPVGETQVVAGCSGGLALFPDAGQTQHALFDRADYALYHSKEGHRGTTTLFSPEHEKAIHAERALETALQTADLAAEMEVHYQPILDTATNRVAMVEGLARWTSPTLGRVPPDRFIAVAERCGMIHVLTILLLRKALADAARLPPEIGLSFNLSSQDLVSPETVVGILGSVLRSGIAPQRITLELTETALIQDFERAKQAITTFRVLGMKVALDDFGTGYSSLGYVHRLPLDKIKIDRSFIADITNGLGRSVVATILDLCQHLGLDGIAEGVETPEQLAAMRGYGCRYVQGYLIGPPMPLPALLAHLSEDGPKPAARLCA